MRIIAGEFRGRRLLPPQGDVTRPITDRVKQSLFDILSPRIEGANVYDLFAGTGSMGLECLSRGARHCTFFENDRSAASLLQKNVEALGVGDRSRMITEDLFRWFGSVVNSRGGSGSTDLIFLDPPYRFLKEQPDALKRLAKRLVLYHLKPDGIVIFRHDAADEMDLPSLAAIDQREYGSMTIELLGKIHSTPA